jgi:Na+/proline symporter
MQKVNMNSTEMNDMHVTPLMGWLDLGVFSAMLGASAVIGCYFGCCSGYKQNAREYLMAGKSMGIVPVSLSLVAR